MSFVAKTFLSILTQKKKLCAINYSTAILNYLSVLNLFAWLGQVTLLQIMCYKLFNRDFIFVSWYYQVFILTWG